MGNNAKHFRCIIIMGDQQEQKAYSFFHASKEDLTNLVLNGFRNSEEFVEATANAFLLFNAELEEKQNLETKIITTMKKILFEKLKLLNFCGIRELEVNFGEDLTVISGRNGIGKSTIANALTYVLFGTDLKGNTFDIKTFDRDHNIIPEIEHSAELTLRCIEPDDVPGEHDDFVFKRTLTDSWKGDKCTNTYKYFINDEVCTAGEFKKCVDSICPEVTFRLCSSATDFVSRPWAEQRKFLQQLVPEITADAITQGDTKYDFVLEALKKQDIETLVHHIKYKRTEIQKLLDEVPIRLQELNKTLPDAEDWEDLAAELQKKQNEFSGVGDKIASCKMVVQPKSVTRASASS